MKPRLLSIALPLLFLVFASPPASAQADNSAGGDAADGNALVIDGEPIVPTVPLGENPIRELMHDDLVGNANSILNVEYWQWIGIAVIVLLGVIIDQVVRVLLRTATAARIKRRGGEVKDETLKATVRPFGLVAGAIVWLLLLPLLSLPDTAYRFLQGALSVYVIFAGTWAAWRVIDLIAHVLSVRAEKTDNKFDDILIPLMRKTARVLVIVIGILFAATALRLPIVPLLGSLGLGSLAFAFAAKDTIENFFGSVAVVLDRPFEVGDWVVIEGDTEGTVEELGFRSTRIRTFYNSQITVPNATLVRATVDNYGRRKYRRWKTHVGVQYDTPPSKLIAFTEGIRELVRSHPYTRKDYYQVWMNQWSSSSMDVLLYVFFEVPDWSTELRERERLFIDIVRLADKLGVQFAFPTQTVHLFKEEHKPYKTQHETPGSSSDMRSMVSGIRVARELVKNQSWKGNPPGAVSYSLEGVESLLDEAGNITKEKDTAASELQHEGGGPDEGPPEDVLKPDVPTT